MSDSPDSTGRLDRASLRYLARVFETDHPSDEPFVLNRTEQRLIRWGRLTTFLVAIGLGVLLSTAFFLPQRFWPQYFSWTHFGNWDWPFISILYALLLIYIEVYLLHVLHTLAIKFISLICQFPRYHDAEYNKNMAAVTEQVVQKGTLRQVFSAAPIVPHTVPVFLWISTVKALLTALVFIVLFRFALASTLPDGLLWLIGLSFAGWNGWASYRIMHDAQIRILAPLTIRQFVNELMEEYGRENNFRDWIPTTLQAASVAQNQTNYPNLVLVKALGNRFNIRPETMTRPSDRDLWSCPSSFRDGIARLLLFSTLIDGNLQPTEVPLLQTLSTKKWLNVSLQDIKTLHRDYIKGRGLWV
ncbi:LBF_2804 family protein [Tellurirhabdus bombi]|uniref:LBF_2804 family protein n=1 Tax=Tellurirhabdus bombi TaxID=2907205 RepID=UPI001F2A3333|nr:hypothetical protein [Tellurirhabdus bombi]